MSDDFHSFVARLWAALRRHGSHGVLRPLHHWDSLVGLVQARGSSSSGDQGLLLLTSLAMTGGRGGSLSTVGVSQGEDGQVGLTKA